jgi:2-polyprenyl-3-methyl-5-hydroxy-6-metoxy-1,4-benzoquinol methylase
MEKEIILSCPLCGSNEINFFSQKRGYKLYICASCKLVFISPTPASLEVYDDSYFSGADKGFGYVDYDTDKEPMSPVFHGYLDLVSSFGIKKGNLLDIGAATGFFMDIARKRGFTVTGVELSNYAAEKGRNKGLNIVTGDLKSARFLSGSFDIVTMFDVIEHVPDPIGFIAEATRILKKDGLLLINTPDAQSLWARMWGSRWQLIMPPEHIHYFSPENLGNYLSHNGYQVELSTKIGKWFTLQYVFKMLYKWQGSRLFLTGPFLNKFLSKISLPINLRDNFFMIARKIHD